jgi:hypothetical protein
VPGLNLVAQKPPDRSGGDQPVRSNHAAGIGKESPSAKPEGENEGDVRPQNRVCLGRRLPAFTVREPFPTHTNGTSLAFGRVTPVAPLTLESQMPENGVIFSYGIEKDFLEFNSGTHAEVTLAERKGVLVL